MSKYKNVKTRVGGRTFDSKKEAEAYKLLSSAEAGSGELADLQLQPRFVLQEGFTDREGHRHRPITYTADFLVKYKDGREVVIDVKGIKTNIYKLKKKLFIKKYPQYFFEEW